MNLLLVSAFFMISGAIGILRLPDVYNRIHASTLITVGGAIVGLLILAFESYKYSSTASTKMLLIVIILALTSPTASHMIANAAYAKGIKPYEVKKNVPC